MKWTTRRHVISAVTGLILALAASSAFAATAKKPATAQKAPRLDFAQFTGPLGKITHGDKRAFTFEVKNLGNAPLEISNVAPFCGCTVVKFDKTVPPGGTGKITAEVDTLTLGSGPGSTHVLVESNDTARPEQRLDLTYEVVDYLFAKPGYARWKSTQGEKEGTIQNVIWTNDGTPFHIVDVESPYPHLRASFRPATEAERNPKVTGDQWAIDLTLASMAPVGAIVGHVLIHTDHPQQKLIVLPISGFMRPTMFVFPEVGDFGNLEPSKLPVRASFKVSNFATEAIQITNVEVEGVPGATAEVTPVEAGREYKLYVTLPAGMTAGPFAGQIKIHTDSAKAPVVSAPVKGTITSAQAQAN